MEPRRQRTRFPPPSRPSPFSPSSTMTSLSKGPKLFTGDEKLVMTLVSPTCPGGRGGDGREVMRVQKSSGGPQTMPLCSQRPALHSHPRCWAVAGMATPEPCFTHKDRVWGAVPTLAAFLPPASPLSLALCMMIPPWCELGLREARPCCPHTPHSLVVLTHCTQSSWGLSRSTRHCCS